MPVLAAPPTRPPALELTPDDLLRLPDGEHCELVDGHLVEKEMGFLTSEVTAEVQFRIRAVVREGKLGWAPAQECGYQCFPDDPGKVRKPDASFIAYARLPLEAAHEGWVRIPPDLAVEVVSPNDPFEDVQRKVREYLGAGVALIWVVSPAGGTVMVYRQDGRHSLLGESDTLTGDDVLPGFSVPVAELFPVRPPVGSPVEAAPHPG